MARTVEDLHLAMTVLAAASIGAPDTVNAPAYPPALPAVERVRFAIQLDASSFACAPAVRRAVAEAAKRLTAHGATAVEFEGPPLGGAFAAQGGPHPGPSIGRQRLEEQTGCLLDSRKRGGAARSIRA